MKKKVLLLMGIFSLGLLNAQVGINTKTPLKVFHIDPKGDTNSTGTVGYTDDIVVTEKGYLGVGTINPTAHVHIDKGTADSFIRIEDTSEGTGDKFLKSDESGNGTWIPRVKLAGKVYRMTSPSEIVYYLPATNDYTLSFNKVKSDTGPIVNNTDGGFIRIDNDGSYILTFRWWGNGLSPAFGSSSPNIHYNVLSANLKIRKVVGGVVQPGNIDNVKIYANSIPGNMHFGFVISLFAPNLKKNDLLAVVINPTEVQWIIGYGLSVIGDQYNNVIYYPSVMVYNI